MWAKENQRLVFVAVQLWDENDSQQQEKTERCRWLIFLAGSRRAGGICEGTEACQRRLVRSARLTTGRPA